MTPELNSTDARVLLLAPTKRDAEVTSRLLTDVGLQCIGCDTLERLRSEMARGVGTLVLTDQALGDPSMPSLLAALADQPAWSDVPTVLLTRDRERTPAAARNLAALSNVTLLDRPSSTRSMISAVQSALRSRQRQLEIRDVLAQMRRAEEALLDADVRKDEFLATLAHELRNPLAAIHTGVQVLKQRSSEQAHVERLAAVFDRQSRLLIKLIDDLLDVTRIATGKIVLQRARLDFRSVVEAAVETSQVLVDAARHELRLDLPADPVWVLGDWSRLTQVVGNLINNAVKYTREGGRIVVTLEQRPDAAVLEVSDNGFGIPPDMLPIVFDMFTQVNRTLDRAQGGLGIGLSLVRRLVGLHGGQVQARSDGADLGSTFAIELPLTSAGGDDPAPPPHAAVPLQKRILVIDDNRDVADPLAALLEIEGHDVRTAYSGAAGLRAAETFHPQVVFCDIGMPGMDGHQVATRLRADPRHRGLLLIAITGWGTEDQQRQARLSGFDLHMTKPIDFEKVEALLAP